MKQGSLPYYLGLPIWSKACWRGALFRSDAKAADYLAQYAQVFNTVEGNTTFYSVPSSETVVRWRSATPPSFRFCFKFPRHISHDLGLRDCAAETDRFLQRMQPLGKRLGPFFLQLPPYFSDLELLHAFLARLPMDFQYAVEVRHPNFYDGAAQESAFQQLLQSCAVDRVLFDTTRLHGIRSEDGDIQDAQRRKPTNPRRVDVWGQRPFLRYAGNPEVADDGEGVAFWAEQVARWIKAGHTPYVFMHQAPEDDDAPQLARDFHHALQVKVPALPQLPAWPGESEPEPPEQLSLFE